MTIDGKADPLVVGLRRRAARWLRTNVQALGSGRSGVDADSRPRRNKAACQDHPEPVDAPAIGVMRHRASKLPSAVEGKPAGSLRRPPSGSGGRALVLCKQTIHSHKPVC